MLSRLFESTRTLAVWIELAAAMVLWWRVHAMSACLAGRMAFEGLAAIQTATICNLAIVDNVG